MRVAAPFAQRSSPYRKGKTYLQIEGLDLSAALEELLRDAPHRRVAAEIQGRELGKEGDPHREGIEAERRTGQAKVSRRAKAIQDEKTRTRTEKRERGPTIP